MYNAGLEAMLFHGVLSNILGSRVKTRVLEQLIAFPHKEYTGRELASYAGVSQPQAATALHVFKENGLVEFRKAGHAHLWKLNGSHLLVRQLKEASEPASQLKKILLAHLKKTGCLPKVSRLVLFGSVARGTERPSSDIDLLVIVNKKEDKREVTDRILELSVELASILGNPLLPVVYSIEEARAKKDGPLLKNIEAEGRTLYEKGGKCE